MPITTQKTLALSLTALGKDFEAIAARMGNGAYDGSMPVAESSVPSSGTAKVTQLDRIESKLDALLDALADEGRDEEIQESAYDLDGFDVHGERDGLEPL